MGPATRITTSPAAHPAPLVEAVLDGEVVSDHGVEHHRGHVETRDDSGVARGEVGHGASTGGDGRLAGDVDAAGEVLGERGDHMDVDVEGVEARVGDLVDESCGKLVERGHRATTVDGSVCGAGEN